MALMRGKLLAGALFAGALFGQATEVVEQPVCGCHSPVYAPVVWNILIDGALLTWPASSGSAFAQTQYPALMIWTAQAASLARGDAYSSMATSGDSATLANADQRATLAAADNYATFTELES